MRKRLPSALTLAVACAPADPADPADPTADPCATPGVICTFVGVPGLARYDADGLDRLNTATYLPFDATFAPDGRLFFLDMNNHRVRAVEADGRVFTQAGDGYLGDGVPGAATPPEGPALAWRFNHPCDLAFDPARPDRPWIVAFHNSRLVELALGATPEDNVAKAVAGDGARAFAGDGGPASEATFDLPSSVVFGPDGEAYVSDQCNDLVRRISADGTVSTVAGKVETRPTWGDQVQTSGWPGYAGDGGPALEARLQGLCGGAAFPGSKLALDGRWLYLADTMNHMIRRIDLDSGRIERFAGRVETRTGDLDHNPRTPDTTATGGFPGFDGDGGDRLDAAFARPTDVAVAGDGTVFVADSANDCVRRIDPDGVVSTFAGICGEPGMDGDGGPADAARLMTPLGVAIAPDGSVLIADTGNHVLRRVPTR